MNYIKNYFEVDFICGEFVIKDGALSLPDNFKPKYFLIEDSLYNNGVHVKDELLEDEIFNGYITALAPPKEFLSLVDEITVWQENNAEQANSPFQSESFNGYSYTAKTGSNGSAYSWKDAFRARLNAWRKI